MNYLILCFFGFSLIHTICDALVDAYSRDVISNLNKKIEELKAGNKIPTFDGHDYETAKFIGENSWHVIKTISRLALLLAGIPLGLIFLSKGLLFSFILFLSPLPGLMALWQMLYNYSRFRKLAFPYVLNIQKFTWGIIKKQYLISEDQMVMSFSIMIFISIAWISLIFQVL